MGIEYWVIPWVLGVGHSMGIGYWSFNGHWVFGHWVFFPHSDFEIDSSFGFRNSTFAVFPYLPIPYFPIACFIKLLLLSGSGRLVCLAGLRSVVDPIGNVE